MEAIILAGGFGTRLNHIISDVPKPMAPVNGKPFLEYILEDLNNKGFKRAILAVGYMSDVIVKHFGSRYKNIDLIYSFEETPLGTGGAIKKALNIAIGTDVFIFNGDTFFDCDMVKMFNFHIQHHSELTIAIKNMRNFDRYGTLEIEKDRIVNFKEKRYMDQGDINGGIYIIKKEKLDSIRQQQFSFEKEVLESKLLDMYAFKSCGYFIDIGIPVDYEKAQMDFK